jgi:carbon-monoxide dehydrogenase small subunit
MMKIPVTLNGEQAVLNAEADTKLIDALRRKNCVDVKCGCSTGVCGSCAVLLDDVPVPACVIYACSVRNSSIITLDYFMTLPAYVDIKKGFEHAGIELCGYCNAGKIFGAYHLIMRYKNLTRKQIYFLMASLKCKCADENLLTNGVVYASTFKEKRQKKERNA